MRGGGGISFRALIGGLFFGVFLACLILVYALQVGFVEKYDLERIKTHAESQTASIALLLQPDVMSGFYPAIVQRANRVLELQPEIVGLSVKMRDGYVVFEKVKEKSRPDEVLILERRILPSALSGQMPAEGEWIGSIIAHFDLEPHAALMKKQRRTIAAFGFLFLLFALGLSAAVSGSLSRPIQRLAMEMKRGDLDNLVNIRPEGAERISELRDLYAQTHLLAKQNLEYQIQLVRRAKEAALAEFASQVAHDIRSPLAALEVSSADADKLSEEQRVLIRSAVGRIRDIANSLLDKQRAQAAGEAGSGAAPPSCLLLSGLIESLITEKRLQYRSRPGIEIEARLGAPSYGIFASVQPIEFKRLLSNLVNNAVESFGDGRGSVHVALSTFEGKALIRVRDDGKGIPLHMLSKLGKRGETHGKSGGSGLGLHHARSAAESWGGSLEIVSEPSEGTTVTVILPQALPPEWFVSELILISGRAVVILDDDASIHQVWDGRLGAPLGRGIEVVHISAPDELRSWLAGNANKARGARYLLDYELLGFRDTGLSLARELGIGGQSILVTSHHEEPAILDDCRVLGTRIIPKGLAAMVPIVIESQPREGVRWDAVLIDDDALARTTWAIAASRLGKELRVFSSAAEFVEVSPSIDRDTPIYVDAELDGDVWGDAEALRIRELGFTEIYLATGHQAEKFAGLTHLRGVVGKEPPWGPRERG